MFALGQKQLETRIIVRISTYQSLLHTQETLTNFHEDEAKKYKQNWEKKYKMADSKKTSFSKLPILNTYFLAKILGTGIGGLVVFCTKI